MTPPTPIAEHNVPESLDSSSTPRTASSSQASDRELVAALLGGDRHAGEALLERNYASVFRTLIKLTGDRDLASDLTQDAFQRAWTSLRGFRGDAAFSSWMYRIAYTTFLNHIRRPHLVQPVDDLERHAEGATSLQSQSEGALQHLSRIESEQRLRNAVISLPDRQRMAITAKFWGDLSTSEIANLESVSAVAIRKRIRKALATLATTLGTEASTLPNLTCVGDSAS